MTDTNRSRAASWEALLATRKIVNTAWYVQVQTVVLQRVYLKYHPGEHELFEAVDDAYERRLENLISGKGVVC